MTTQAEQLRERTKQFAIRIVKLFRALPKTEEARVLGKQVLRSGTSVAANYRAVCRAKSQADFVSKLGTTVEEADETLLWLELLEDSATCAGSAVAPLKSEAGELVRILQTSLTTAKNSYRSLNQ